MRYRRPTRGPEAVVAMALDEMTDEQIQALESLACNCMGGTDSLCSLLGNVRRSRDLDWRDEWE